MARISPSEGGTRRRPATKHALPVDGESCYGIFKGFSKPWKRLGRNGEDLGQALTLYFLATHSADGRPLPFTTLTNCRVTNKVTYSESRQEASRLAEFYALLADKSPYDLVKAYRDRGVHALVDLNDYIAYPVCLHIATRIEQAPQEAGAFRYEETRVARFSAAPAAFFDVVNQMLKQGTITTALSNEGYRYIKSPVGATLEYKRIGGTIHVEAPSADVAQRAYEIMGDDRGLTAPAEHGARHAQQAPPSATPKRFQPPQVDAQFARVDRPAAAPTFEITERDIAEALRRDPESKPGRSVCESSALRFKYGLSEQAALNANGRYAILPPRDLYEQHLANWWEKSSDFFWSLPQRDPQTVKEVIAFAGSPTDGLPRHGAPLEGVEPTPVFREPTPVPGFSFGMGMR